MQPFALNPYVFFPASIVANSIVAPKFRVFDSVSCCLALQIDVTIENTRHTFCFPFYFLFFSHSWIGHDCIMSSAQFPVEVDDTVFFFRSFCVCVIFHFFFCFWLRLLNVEILSGKSHLRQPHWCYWISAWTQRNTFENDFTQHTFETIV